MATLRHGRLNDNKNAISNFCICGKKITRDKSQISATCKFCGRVYTSYGASITDYLLCIGFIGDYDPLGM